MNVTKRERSIRVIEYAVPLIDGSCNAKDVVDAIGWAQKDYPGKIAYDDLILIRFTDEEVIVYLELQHP